jgi:hypothetical protein
MNGMIFYCFDHFLSFLAITLTRCSGWKSLGYICINSPQEIEEVFGRHVLIRNASLHISVHSGGELPEQNSRLKLFEIMRVSKIFEKNY